MSKNVIAGIALLVFAIVGAMIPKFVDDIALTLCLGKFNVPECNERLVKEKAEAYKRAMEKH